MTTREIRVVLAAVATWAAIAAPYLTAFGVMYR